MTFTNYAMRVYSDVFPLGVYVIELGWYASEYEAMSEARRIYNRSYRYCDGFNVTTIN